MTGDRHDTGAADEARVKLRLRVAATVVLLAGALGWMFIPGIRGTDVAFGTIVAGGIILALIDANKVPWPWKKS